LRDEREIWARIRSGDAAAFEGVYREEGARVKGFLRQVLRDTHAAEDVMQETFAQIWQRPNGFVAERGTLRAYLFGAARRRAADWRRKGNGASARAVGVEAAEGIGSADARNSNPGSGSNLGSGHGGAETVSLIADALGRLPEEQSSLLWLREVEGFSYEELAGILGVPVGTVRSRLFAAREGLRTVWHSNAKAKKEGA
jgi:RNA polymerase sigma-70 factor (ECF subfamily)